MENEEVKKLKELAKDEDWWVREMVAGNENTPPEVLAELAKDKEYQVRLCAHETIEYLQNQEKESEE